MVRFVGAEYFVANMLIEEIKIGKDYVSFETLSECGIYVQKRFIEADMDVILLISKQQFIETIYDFSDYFECITDKRRKSKRNCIKEK